jgi:hypothetical protein
MKYPKLRIAWSVGWGLVTVLLCILWVWSYWRMDIVNSPTSRKYFELCQSIRGKLNFSARRTENTFPQNGWVFAHMPLETLDQQTYSQATGETNLDRIGSGWSFSPNGFQVLLPHWVFAGLILMMAAAPWLVSDRFTVRTLLIAMTLVAALLGVIVYRNGRGMN